MSKRNETLWKVLAYINLNSELPKDLISLNLALGFKEISYTLGAGIDETIENLKTNQSIVKQGDEWFLTSKGQNTFKKLNPKFNPNLHK